MPPQSITSIHNLIMKKQLSCQELVKSYLDKIKKDDGKIHAFLEVWSDEVMAKAKKVDAKIAKKEKIGLLEGILIALKDNLLYKNHLASSGSKILEKYIASYSATAVKKLEDVGAIFIGRTNMDEFAMGSSTENSAYGPTKNPRDLSQVTGGSSGGSAAAVTAKMCVAALGSDTGGSIRQPAAFCGAVGLKPTYSAVSRYGLMAMSSSLDQIGPLANTVEDAEIIFNAIKGRDAKDATSSVIARSEATKQSRFRNDKIKIGIPKEYFVSGLDPQIKQNILATVAKLEKDGAEVKKISLPHTDYALAAYYLIMPAEVSSNLARFDGVKYGLSSRGKAKNLLEMYNQTRANGFGAEAKRRIILGTFALSAGYYDAYYKKARQTQEIIKQDFVKTFKDVDYLITPTTPTTAFKLGERTDDPLTMYLSDIFTVSVNLAGLPAISIPNGLINGLPVGLQIISRPFEENNLFELGKIIETTHYLNKKPRRLPAFTRRLIIATLGRFFALCPNSWPAINCSAN
ncbi:MAG: Asp-tRNA(Asn)/Glu-tRNA(Gln) amidotransferase subunit GatA [Candidatus Magasanikbacteria bacterium]|nr:Asp-tRNA(Asn)/Glu-tRNA(Gln) amidotransferase subunit GatA [Candidatus Magasanikbacteria bacterium]